MDNGQGCNPADDIFISDSSRLPHTIPPSYITALYHTTIFLALLVPACPSTVCQGLAAAIASLWAIYWHVVSSGMAWLKKNMLRPFGIWAGSLWTTVSEENVTLGYGNMPRYHGAGGVARRFHDWVAKNRRMLLAFGSKVQPKREAGTARGRVFGVWIKRFSLHGIISERGNTEGLTWSLVFLLACAQIKQRG